MLKLMQILNIKHLRYFYLLLISVVLILGILLWTSFSGYYNVFAVTYGNYNYPFITTEFQGNTHTLGLSIGCRFPLSLCQQTLDSIDKQFQGSEICRNFDGKQKETFTYFIPKLKVGKLVLKNVVAYESDRKDCDILGKFLGGEFNLLLDFPHDRIIACDSFYKLQTKKLVDKSWVQLPFEMHRAGIVFHVDTDFGTRKLVINTGCTINLLNSSLISSDARFPFISSRFALKGCHFGNITFESIDLPEGLEEIDGFIGMDFLKEHAIYLDYTLKIAYIEPPRKYFEHISVTFDNHNIPTINGTVEGTTYPLRLDLGSMFPFAFREEILQNIRKFQYGTARWHDFRGKKYESPMYTVPEIKINNLKFTHVYTKQDRDDFHVNATLQGLPLVPLGVIGLPILEKYNLFLDFPHSAIYASSDHLLLQRAGLLSQNLLPIPFTRHPDGILLSIETDLGTYRLILDTGSTRTVIRAPHSASTARFCIKGHDFGERSVIAIDLSPQLDFDGCIGMDFLRDYPLFIDYPNKIIFVDLQKNSS
jgi:hypothetical protein